MARVKERAEDLAGQIERALPLVERLTGEMRKRIVGQTALLDRLAHHATVITTKGKSYRMRKRRGPG